MSVTDFLSFSKKLLLDSFLKNKRLKLLAFCFAVIIWAIATVSLKKSVSEIVLPVMLTYTDPPPNLIIKNPLPNRVNSTLFVRGLNNSNRFDFIISVDLSTIRSGNNQISLKEQKNNFPENTDFFSVEPSFINVTAEETVVKMVDVKLDYGGKLKDGHILKKISVNPNQILVKGPKSQIGELDFIKTDRIDLQNEDKSFNRATTPILPKYFKLVNENDRNLSVTGLVNNVFIQKVFRGVSVEMFGIQYKTTLKPNKISLTLLGPKNIIDGINSKDLKGYFDADALPPGIHTAKDIILELPQSVKILSYNPKPKIHVSKRKIVKKNSPP